MATDTKKKLEQNLLEEMQRVLDKDSVEPGDLQDLMTAAIPCDQDAILNMMHTCVGRGSIIVKGGTDGGE